MKMKAREALDNYYEQAGSWGADQQAALRGSRRVAWIVASAFALIAVLEALALWWLTPLKTVEPYTLLVDRQTGYVQVLKPLEASEIAGNTALTQSFLVQYVIAREGFDIDSVQNNYRKVALWSEGGARTDYVNTMQPSNPDSPLARYPRSSIVETRVKSVSPMPGNTAMVRFETIRRDAGGQAQPPQSFVAMIRYRYSNEPMSVEDRYVNPLGFQVTRYTRSAETLPAAQPDAPEAQGGQGATPAASGPPPIVVPQTNSPQAPATRRRADGVEITL